MLIGSLCDHGNALSVGFQEYSLSIELYCCQISLLFRNKLILILLILKPDNFNGAQYMLQQMFLNEYHFTSDENVSTFLSNIFVFS